LKVEESNLNKPLFNYLISNIAATQGKYEEAPRGKFPFLVSTVYPCYLKH
jgi:hypothetical protein